LIIADCYLPSGRSAAQLIHDLAHEFVRQGNEISILIPSDTITNGLDEQNDCGVKIIRFKVGKIKGNTHFERSMKCPYPFSPLPIADAPY
jgi:hypothetical protein